MTQRQLIIGLTDNDMTSIAESIGGWDKLWSAIGYLSTWNTSYPYVQIHRDHDTDLTAVYLDADQKCRYVIGAVWHGEHYGFHS